MSALKKPKIGVEIRVITNAVDEARRTIRLTFRATKELSYDDELREVIEAPAQLAGGELEPGLLELLLLVDKSG